jgi:hypothetical protein
MMNKDEQKRNADKAANIVGDAAIPMPPIPPQTQAAAQQQQPNAAVRPASPVPNPAAQQGSPVPPNAGAAVVPELLEHHGEGGYSYSAAKGWPEHFRPVTALDRSQQPQQQQQQEEQK